MPGPDDDTREQAPQDAHRRLAAATAPAPQRHADDGTAPAHPRYEHRGLLGAGGQGVVHRVHDRELGRDVALKTLRQDDCSPRRAQEFIDEACAAAQLEHPHIVPIHDVGRLDDGRPYYTMRLLPGRSLAEVLDLLAAANDAATRRSAEWSMVRLVQVVQATCKALQFAHDRGVVHRDIKPANILLGEFGEVFVVDWGIATGSARRAARTASGVVKGTTAYLSPEQARALPLDGRSDVFSLGIVLYEVLTLKRPFRGDSTAEMLASILRDEPDDAMAAGAPDRIVPAALAELARAMMIKDRDQRIGSARAADDAIQAFLEGTRERERRREQADDLRAQAKTALRRHEEALQQAALTRTEIARLESVHRPWEPVGSKRALIDARRRLDLTDRVARASFLEAVNRLTDALAHLPDHPEARETLTDLFWSRFLAAEEDRDEALADTYRALVEHFHDGRLARELRGSGSLALHVSPPDAMLTIHPLVEKDLVLVDGPGRPFDGGEARETELEMGSYVVLASADGHDPVRYPLLITRNLRWTGELHLPPIGAVPKGFVFVPGCTTTLGGDALATNGWPRRRVTLESFAISRHPVTFGEYCAFLASLDEDTCAARMPRTETDGPCLERSISPSGVTFRWLRELSAAVIATHGPDAWQQLPVCAIDRPSASAHASWLGSRLGMRCRLPTAEEWELVARGVDRRIYPWGNAYDSSLCHVRDSIEGEPDMAPVGSFPTDRGVHGVQDLAGCMQEWTSSWFAEERGMAEARGGGWYSGPTQARAGWRGLCQESTRNPQLGFRVVVELSEAR